MPPTVPLENATGTNTAHSTIATPISALLIWLIALRVASSGGKPSSCITRSTFSTTTMASSTSKPIASTRPNIDKVLIEKPSADITPKVPSSTTGTVIEGISVARTFCKNRYITRNTSTIPSSRVLMTSSIEILTKGVTSFG